MEELDIPGVLAHLEPYHLSPIERVVAAHTGTVQLLLSLISGEPVDVRIFTNEMDRQSDEIKRTVELVARNSQTIMGYAYTTIPVKECCNQVIERVLQAQMGIGQIAVALGIPTTRHITDIYCDSRYICRDYRMEGPGLVYNIRERFPRWVLTAQQYVRSRRSVAGEV